ncbi:hypothetical protein LX16_0938 [Stackebrandtia albiflava]|uniref:Uncharacterized protein n=1 Tax=Stackebrandtia albiflava TaxID=406432 RepID=A0A562VBK1_9ACTN|nr:hypothetical protein [Stackebrandtia albiflava]TWJ15238.1 hypothetical protein LX16_0938 [Stackebrandtia albiflava]
MTAPRAEWCIVATLLPYPYDGDKQGFRSHGIFPAGSRLHVIGGFAGMGHETVTVVGFSHGRRRPVSAFLPGRYLGGWRARLVYRPAILRRIHQAEEFDSTTAHRWRHLMPGDHLGRIDATDPEYGDVLASVAAWFQRRFHGDEEE